MHELDKRTFSNVKVSCTHTDGASDKRGIKDSSKIIFLILQ